MAQFPGHLVPLISLPLNSYLWGYVKDIMYRTKIRDISDLKQRITDAIATIDEAKVCVCVGWTMN